MQHDAERFEALQRKLAPLWKTLAAYNQEEQTIVVGPPLSVDVPFLKGSMLQAYEERFLFLLLLRQPRARLVYVTSQAIAPEIVDSDRAHLVPFNTTVAERSLALGIPMHGADPRHLPLGTKSGARRLFRQEGARLPALGELKRLLLATSLERPPRLA